MTDAIKILELVYRADRQAFNIIRGGDGQSVKWNPLPLLHQKLNGSRIDCKELNTWLAKHIK